MEESRNIWTLDWEEKYTRRFWIKVIIGGQDECWLWNGAKTDTGYGVFKFKNRMLKVHRISYFVAGHELFKDKVIDHTCGNKLCCNPKHLEQVTQSVNAIRYQRSAFKYLCRNGHPKEYGRPCKECNKLAVYKWKHEHPATWKAIQQKSYIKLKRDNSMS